MSDYIIFRATQVFRTRPMKVVADTIITMKDGSIAILPAGCVLMMPDPETPMEIEVVEPVVE